MNSHPMDGLKDELSTADDEAIVSKFVKFFRTAGLSGAAYLILEDGRRLEVSSLASPHWDTPLVTFKFRPRDVEPDR